MIMTKKTWELVFDEIKRSQPVKAVEIRKKLNLSEGQVAGALATIREKNIVEQLEDRSYLVRDKSKEELLKEDLDKLLKKYSSPTEEDSSDYKQIYSLLSEIVGP